MMNMPQMSPLPWLALMMLFILLLLTFSSQMFHFKQPYITQNLKDIKMTTSKTWVW